MTILSRALAAVAALALFLGGLLAGAELISQLWRHEPWLMPYDHWYRSARANTWSDQPVRWLCLALVAAGIVLLVAALSKRPPRTLDLRTRDGTTAADVQLASLEKSLARAALSVDGVTDATVRVNPVAASVETRTISDDRDEVKQRVDDAVRQRLGPIDLAQPLPVRVQVAGKDGR